MKEIYLDHSASTPTDPRVLKIMVPYFTEEYGNPLSQHGWGETARKAVENARIQIATLLHSIPPQDIGSSINSQSVNNTDLASQEIIFTSSGSESNNLAMKGIAHAYQKKGKHIIISAMEHESVSKSAKSLQKEGFEITTLPVDNYGLTKPEDVEKNIRKDTILLAVIHASHEVGTIQPLEDIGKICREKKIPLFSDGIASVGTIPVNVKELHVDAMSFASNMFYGPPGIAGLYLRNGIRLNPIIDGGRQENYHRAGTLNVPGIVGMGTAAELASIEVEYRTRLTQKLRDLCWKDLSKKVKGIFMTGHPIDRLPHHLSFCLEHIAGEAILLSLELELGVAASTGFLCGDEENKTSAVLTAMGISPKLAGGAIRFTMGKDNTIPQIQMVCEKFPSLVEKFLHMRDNTEKQNRPLIEKTT